MRHDLNEDEIRDAAHWHMIAGSLWCLAGIAVTALTYAAASGGGRYVVAWGAIVYGGVRFVRGVVALSQLGKKEACGNDEAHDDDDGVSIPAPRAVARANTAARTLAAVVVAAVVVVTLVFALAGRPAHRDRPALPETITLPDDLRVIDIPNPNGAGTIPSLGRVDDGS